MLVSAVNERAVIHMDLDAFFASVEQLRDSRLKHKPLIIGGQSGRGVVASCSYEARRFGVRSAMPMRLAKQLCPDAKVISGDMEAYAKYSHNVTDIIKEAAPVFEKSSIDEFYIDASGMDRFFGCYQWGSELRQRVIHETGLPISMGLSINKMVAKVATGESKPNGQRHIERGHERDFLAPFPVRKIPMIGEKNARFLNEMGIHTVKTLREMPVKLLENAFGKHGFVLWQRAHGIDHSPIVPYTERKSISTENTFDTDTIDVKKLRAILIGMVEKIGYKLRSEHKLTGCVTVKLRYANFDTTTRQVQLPYTSSDHVLIPKVLQLFEKLYDRRMRIRLVGVRFSKLVHGNYQIDLFNDTEPQIKLYQAMDGLRHKFGTHAVGRAISLNVKDRGRESTNIYTG